MAMLNKLVTSQNELGQAGPVKLIVIAGHGTPLAKLRNASLLSEYPLAVLPAVLPNLSRAQTTYWWRGSRRGLNPPLSSPHYKKGQKPASNGY